MDAVPQTATRTRKPRGQGASRHGEILIAAKRLFLDNGVDHVTMRRIAASVGVSATALYVYFPDKEAILRAIAAESFLALIDAHQKSMRPHRSASDNLRAGLQTYVAFALAHPDEYRLVFLRTSRRDSFDPCNDVPEGDIGFGLLVASVQAMIDAREFPDRPAMLMAEAIWACMHGLVALLLTHAGAVESAPDDLVCQVVDMAIAGLRTAPHVTLVK